MKKISVFILILGFSLQVLHSQNSLELVNSNKISDDRYEGIKGDPYRFDNWLIANITNTDDEIINEVFVNLNGLSKVFEVKNGDDFIELDPEFYTLIEIKEAKNGDKFPKGDSERIIFRKGIHAQFKDAFVKVLYEGKQVSVFEHFEASIEEKSIQDVGRTVEIRRFIGKRNHYVLNGSELKKFTLKKPSVIKTFGYKRQLDVFMRKQKIDLSQTKDIKKLFAYYEELLSE